MKMHRADTTGSKKMNIVFFQVILIISCLHYPQYPHWHVYVGRVFVFFPAPWRYHGWPSTQPSQRAHNRASCSTQPGTSFREHGRRGQRYKRLSWKQIFGLQPVSDLNAQFAVCEYLHNVSHIIWLIMNRNSKACLAYVNNVCLRMLGCVHCARLCVSARLCAFLLGCVLCLARLVLVIDGRTVSTWLR